MEGLCGLSARSHVCYNNPTPGQTSACIPGGGTFKHGKVRSVLPSPGGPPVSLAKVVQSTKMPDLLGHKLLLCREVW